MKESDCQNLMDFVFKGTFISNSLTKLFLQKITPEEFKQMIINKKNEIISKNSSLTEEQQYNLLMNTTEINEKATKETVLDKKEEKNTSFFGSFRNFPSYFFIFLLSTLFLSMALTASITSLDKSCLVAKEINQEEVSSTLLEEGENIENTNLEIPVPEKEIKLNLNRHSYLIMPKMEKIVIQTFEGILGFIIKYFLSISNLILVVFGRFIDSKKVKSIKINLTIIFTILPLIRLFMVYNINNGFSTTYNNDLKFYKSDELFSYNPKPLPYSLFNELSGTIWSVFLGLNTATPYVVNIFYQSNNYFAELFCKLFGTKNKIN